MSDAVTKPAKGDKNVSAVTPPFVNRSMRVFEIITACSQAPDIMAAYGLHCFSCSLGGIETLQEGCALHGFDDETIDALVDDINEAIRDEPARPQELTVTLEAAKALQEIAESEGKESYGLAVVADESGGFCMEFHEKPEEDDMVFFHKEVPSMKIFASGLTLWRIGGASIDFVDGRFKLDIPGDDIAPGCCKSGGGCDCKE